MSCGMILIGENRSTRR